MSSKDSLKKAKAELEDLLRLMNVEATVEAFEQGDDEVLLHVESPDAARLIGRGAQVLDALQYILNRSLYKRDAEALHCVVDVERYRERRKDRLLKDAHEAADTVRRSGRPIKLAPMGAADRRVVHQALKDDADVETVSGREDDSGKKRVVVRKKETHKDASPREEGEPPDVDGNVAEEPPAE